MKKIAGFLVDRRYIVLTVFLVITVISGILMTKVNVNYDMTKYLPNDSEMKIGMDVMNEEFEVQDSSLLRVMFRDLNVDEKETIYKELSELKFVDSVDYDINSEDYNKDNNTLYVLNTSYDSYADEAAEVYSAIYDNYSEKYEVFTSGGIATSNTDALPVWIMALAVIIAMVILFIMCESWLEPILFIVTLGIAVVINMGTNALMSSVSNTTHSIVAILQLVLSMDYSIILLNRYRQEKLKNPEKTSAMKTALVNSFAAITSSSVTTFVGLLSLVFMSFKIGADMGVALAKGVLISLICIFTILPAFIIMFDKTIDKLRKRGLNVKMDKIGAFEFKFRYAIAGVFVLFFIGMFLWKGTTDISFSQEFSSEVDEVFEPENTIVMLYDNKDEEKLSEIIEKLENNPDVKSVMGYPNTLGKAYKSNELADVIGNMDMSGSSMDMDSSMLSLVYYDYYKKGEEIKIPLSNLVKFINELSTSGMFEIPVAADGGAGMQMLSMFTDVETVTAERSSPELAQYLGMDSAMIEQLFYMSGVQSMSIQNFLNFMVTNVLPDPQMGAAINLESAIQLQMLQGIVNAAASGKEFTSAEFLQMFGSSMGDLDENTVELLYLYYAAENFSDSEWTLSIETFFNYLLSDIVPDERFASYLDSELKDNLSSAAGELNDGISQLKGDNYGRLIITASLPEDSDETRAFLKELKSDADKLDGKYYLIGNSSMDYEMSESFGSELNKITLITAIAIFITVVITFRSFAIPLVLVLLIQSGVYATMGVIGAQGYSIHYLALLIVQSILMGATIDYAILYTSYYREHRKNMVVKDAISAAYNGSMHTILTSGSIVIIVTAILQFAFADPTIGQIVQTLSIGGLIATLLIIFLLPGVLAAMDRFVVKNGKK